MMKIEWCKRRQNYEIFTALSTNKNILASNWILFTFTLFFDGIQLKSSPRKIILWMCFLVFMLFRSNVIRMFVWYLKTTKVTNGLTSGTLHPYMAEVVAPLLCTNTYILHGFIRHTHTHTQNAYCGMIPTSCIKFVDSLLHVVYYVYYVCWPKSLNWLVSVLFARLSTQQPTNQCNH